VIEKDVLHFAYDGSIHGDWVARYAIRMATRLREPRLHVLYVEDGQLSTAALRQRLAQIELACAELALPLDVTVAPQRKSVAATLVALVPEGSEHLLVCGTRIRPRGRGLLADTVSEHLLRVGQCQVLSVRVMQPGLLGVPRNFLIPVSGRPEGIRVGLPFLRLLVPEASKLEILMVHRVSHRRFGHISHVEAASIVQRGQHYVSEIEATLAGELGIPIRSLDGTSVLSDDIPKEIVIQAGKHKSQLIYMGASASSLRRRSVYGSPIEQVLRSAPCDVAIYGDPP
jgi:nucleotide-binding universal stress UspA family protein